jgi:hypothetical protein
MALIDFRGYRLSAQSLLPIGRDDSLVMGSADAGEHMAGETWALERMAPLGATLNLKCHRIGHSPTWAWGPFDLEGHRGDDGRFYLVDFARLFPPEMPSLEDSSVNGHLYKLLRPELVRSHSVPLCSDTLSMIAVHGAYDHVREVNEATQRLFRFVIPSFAKWLVQQRDDEYPFDFHLHTVMHQRGINMRHLFRVLVAVLALGGAPLSNVTQWNDSAVGRWAYNILSEMVSRTVKGEIREAMRQCQAVSGGSRGNSEDAFRTLLTSHLNKYMVFTPTVGRESWAQINRAKLDQSIHEQYWRELVAHMQRKYDFKCRDGENRVVSEALNCLPLAAWDSTDAKVAAPGSFIPEVGPGLTTTKLQKTICQMLDPHNLYVQMDRRTVFVRLQQMFHVIFTTEVWRERIDPHFWQTEADTRLDANDVVDIQDIVADLDIVSFARAKNLHLTAMRMPLLVSSSADLEDAIEELRDARPGIRRDCGWGS